MIRVEAIGEGGGGYLVIRSGDNKIIINLTILWFEAKNYTAEGSHVRVWVVGRLNMILALRQLGQ